MPSAALPFRSTPRESLASVARPRLDSIDWVRGLVMVLMALDHTRDFVGTSALDPRDLGQPALFVTRWVTHFCAPVFVLLAGVSARLQAGRAGRGKSPAEVRRFLWTRGLWLLLLEWTVVRVAWTFDLLPGFLPMQVIWAIGWSMVALAFLVRLPGSVVGGIGLALVAGHNLLDPLSAADLGLPDRLAWLWTVLHGFGPLPASGGVEPFVAYALIPWIGVIACGYGLGAVFTLPATERRRALYALGAATTALFVFVRAINGYGDPNPWEAQPTGFATLLSFLNCEKYPPSLAFLAMTLGPALLLLAVVDRGVPRPLRSVVVIGRVPLLYYVAHLFVIHAAAVALSAWVGDPLGTLLDGFHPMNKLPGTGFTLPVVYAVFAGVVVALYPLCRWFAALKQRRRDWWLSYL
ncbi:MAG: heparan-alpha-glucosaminide N-acetyltransferase domain-containing protein [Myxococcota bacterium]|nr:heparan-alpha-glucosaminide N-acetyltransferase domain-containing protein [Myxococcota bacterium]